MDTVNTVIGPQIIQSIENNVVDASDTPGHTPPDHLVDSHTGTQPPNDILRVKPTTPCRPSRSHKLPTYLHDYILPKTITNTPSQLHNTNICLNTAFSKHQHIPPEVLEHESQTLVRNISSDDEPSSYGEAAMNPVC